MKPKVPPPRKKIYLDLCPEKKNNEKNLESFDIERGVPLPPDARLDRKFAGADAGPKMETDPGFKHFYPPGN